MTAPTNEARRKLVKHKLIDQGISFREWCRREEVSHSVARDLVYGRMDASRSENIKVVKDKLIAAFGKEAFED